jgi:hypothetical protein
MDLTRREALASLAALAAAPAAAQGSGAADTVTARGTVFEDVASTGVRGANAPGVPGVMVSNGRDVVLTDADGGWSLPLRDGDAVFVVKPSGWAVPLELGTQLPKVSYLYAPLGSPRLGFRFPGLEPSGPLPDSIDFPLRRADEPGDFTALLMTDPQPESLVELGYVRDDVMARLGNVPGARFGITLGDVMFDDLAYYPRHNRIVGALGLPWWNLPGNHDMNLEAPDNALSRETFKRVFGARHAAFQHGGTTVFLLDNVEYLGGGKYQGRFGPEQLGFVRGVLAHVPQDALVLLCFHIPLRTQAGDAPDLANTDTRDFLAAIASHANTASFSGHTHTNEHWYFGDEDGYAPGAVHHHHVLSAASGSWWSGPADLRGIPAALATDGSPNGFHVLQVAGGRYATRLIPAHEPLGGDGGPAAMRIMLETQVHGGSPEVMAEYPAGALLRSPVAAEAVGEALVVVNLFEGGPRSEVQMRVGGGQWRPMRKATRKDPFVQAVYARAGAAVKPWVKPGDSTHVWELPLPAALDPGAYKLAVRALDEHGRQATDEMMIEVTG